jgi:F0F1-type ATP synthase membrane subunit c/vacuolar-type H+-ATPase subunit K
VLRVSWPLAILAAVVVALVARNPRLLVPMIVVFGIWYLLQRAGAGRR